MPNLADERLQFGDHRIELGEIGGEGVFGSNGFPDAVGPDLAIVDADRIRLAQPETSRTPVGES